jgi:hypothetical protein
MEEEKVCRMCHCEGSVERPLFYPCKCSGSIRYVHQDCLLKWLKVKNKFSGTCRCELCGEELHFRNIYKTGSTNPPILSFYELLVAIMPQFCFAAFQVLYFGAFFGLWVIGLPMLTTVTVELFTLALRQRSLNDITLDLLLKIRGWHGRPFALQWWEGVITLSFLCMIGFSLFLLVSYFQSVGFRSFSSPPSFLYFVLSNLCVLLPI